MNADEANIRLDLQLVIAHEGDDLDVVAVPTEEVVFGEQLRPRRRAGNVFVNCIGAVLGSVRIARVDAETLSVAHMDGWFGVMIGMRCCLSLGCNRGFRART